MIQYWGWGSHQRCTDNSIYTLIIPNKHNMLWLFEILFQTQVNIARIQMLFCLSVLCSVPFDLVMEYCCSDVLIIIFKIRVTPDDFDDALKLSNTMKYLIFGRFCLFGRQKCVCLFPSDALSLTRVLSLG